MGSFSHAPFFPDRQRKSSVLLQMSLTRRAAAAKKVASARQARQLRSVSAAHRYPAALVRTKCRPGARKDLARTKRRRRSRASLPQRPQRLHPMSRQRRGIGFVVGRDRQLAARVLNVLSRAPPLQPRALLCSQSGAHAGEWLRTIPAYAGSTLVR